MSTSTPISTAEGTVNADTGRAPDRRFINPNDKADGSWLHTQVARFRMCGDVRDIERKEVEAMLRFTPPYSEDDLRALNLENAPNTTLGEMPRRIAQAENNWVEFTTSSTGLWKISFPDVPGKAADTVGERVSELVNRLWSADPRHCLSMQLVFRQFSTWGLGPLVWNDCYDPSPVARIASSLRFPATTRLTLDNFTEACLEDTITAQELYGIVRGPVGETRSAIHGWNRKEVGRVLKSHATGDGIDSQVWGSLEAAELAERQGRDLWGGYSKRDIRLLHVFVREYTPDEEGNDISHCVLAADGQGWRIIRDKGRAYSDPSQFMVLATDRVGSDMTIAGLRGLGLDLREHCRSTDILHCAGMYASYRSSIPIYAASGGGAASHADQISIRPNGVIIPHGFTEVQSHIDPQASGWYIDRLTNSADTLQGLYSINAPNKGGVQRTAREATFDAAKEAEVRSSQVMPMVRTFFEPLGEEFLRRLFLFPKDKTGAILRYRGWRTVEAFWRGLDTILRETGVPLGLLQHSIVEINPASTPGGLDKKLMRHQAAMAIYPTLQRQEQRDWITNQGLIAIFGYQAAQPYLNESEAPPPSDLVTVLDGENADLAGGFQRRVLPEQDHLAHLGPLGEQGLGHIPFAMQMLHQIQDGGFNPFATDPLEALAEQLRGAVTLHGHITGHLSMLAQNPVIMEIPEVQGYFDFNAQFERVLSRSIEEFQQQAAAKMQQSGQGEDPRTAALFAKTQAEIQAMQAKTQAEIETMQQKQMWKLGNQAQTAEARHQQKNASWVMDEVVKKQQADSDLFIARRKAALDLAAERVKLEARMSALEAQSRQEE